MVEDDKPYFSSVLQHFGTVTRFTVTTEVKRAWWDDLKSMPLHDFKAAEQNLRRNVKWFPKPSEYWAARRIGWT